MVYIVTQTKGKLVDAANLCRDAIRVGDMATARAIYETTTGQQAIADDASVWWKYCAATRIERSAGLTDDDWDSILSISGEERQAKAQCRLARLHKGGTWDYFWEY